jgi:hypothetical protein
MLDILHNVQPVLMHAGQCCASDYKCSLRSKHHHIVRGKHHFGKFGCQSIIRISFLDDAWVARGQHGGAH